MKKILLLLIGLTIISCSSDDEDTRTTDPLIGTWIKSYPVTENGIEYNIAETYIINSDGTYISTDGDEDGIDDYSTQNGVWENDGTDFNLLNQSYAFSGDDYFVAFNYTLQIRFESDFNSFEILNECDELDEDEEYCGVFYIRQ
jgi:hypothetical protein